MEVSGQLYGPAAVFPGKPPKLTEYEAGWATPLLGTVNKRKIYCPFL